MFTSVIPTGAKQSGEILQCAVQTPPPGSVRPPPGPARCRAGRGRKWRSRPPSGLSCIVSYGARPHPRASPGRGPGSGPRRRGGGPGLRGRGLLRPFSRRTSSRLFCPRKGQMSCSFRNLGRRDSALRSSLASVELSADEIPATGGRRRRAFARADWSASGIHAEIFPDGAGKIPERTGRGLCVPRGAQTRFRRDIWKCFQNARRPVLGPGGAHSPCRGSFSGRKSFDCRIGCFPAGAGNPVNVRPLPG